MISMALLMIPLVAGKEGLADLTASMLTNGTATRSEDEIARMQAMKTGALLRFACEAGAIVAEGAPAEAITADLIEAVFGLKAAVSPSPVDGAPLALPLGRRPLLAGGGGSPSSALPNAQGGIPTE